MSNIKINFDSSMNPEKPTIVLLKRNGRIINGLKYTNIIINDNLNDTPEISFKVHKYIDGKKNILWDDIVDFKLVWCKEYNMCFEISVKISESNSTIKNVTGKKLAESELSQIMLYNIEINTENDIARDDYVVTTLYNESNPKASLLNRMLEKAPHYSIKHVDNTISQIQRTFTFNDKSIYDSFKSISEEINCLFIFDSGFDLNGNIERYISVYDLESNCIDCGYRGEFYDSCPICASKNIISGYGNDTTIFITSDELATNIDLESDVDSVKNCFKLETGDDLLTSTVRNCNPNGTDYIWKFSNDVISDMSDELVDKIKSYNDLYKYYSDTYIINIDSDILLKYNNIVNKYKKYNSELENISSPIVGYSNLMNAYYNTIDLYVYLKSSLMPNTELSDTTAIEQGKLLTTANLSPVSVSDASVVSLATSNNAVLSMAKVLIDLRYQVKIENSSLSSQMWTGNFIITNYSDETDTYTTGNINVVIDDDYETFIKQKIEKLLNKESEDFSIVGLFENEYDDFCEELKKYSLDYLSSFYSSCQACIDILIEQGISDKDSWGDIQDLDMYKRMYIPYYNKLKAIETEMNIRQNEVDTIVGKYDIDGNVIDNGVQNYIIKENKLIHESLDFENYLGESLWLEFCTYKREDKYSNDNYISDGLNNAELFKKALEFIDVANKEIYKSSELQYSISSTLNNLLGMEKFKPIIKYFEVGNWIRIQIDDRIFKLRLLSYEVDYDNLENISVEFSNVLKTVDGISDERSVIEQASSMATSYSSVMRQAKQGKDVNDYINNCLYNGLSLTQMKIINDAEYQNITWDNHGMLFRQYNNIADSYSDEQLKIINSTIAITDDGWRTTKTALGKIIYTLDGKQNEIYGLAAQAVISGIIVAGDIYSNNFSNANKTGTHFDLNNGSFSLAGERIVYDGDNSLTLKNIDIDWNNSVAPEISNIEGLDEYLSELNSNKSKVFYSSTAPISSTGNELTINDVWFDTSNGNKMYRWDGSSWEEKLFGNPSITSIDATKITTGTINANRIGASSITSAKLSTDAIKSTNYVANSVGSFLNLADGSFSSKNLKWDKYGNLSVVNGSFSGYIDNSKINFEFDGETCGQIYTDTSASRGGIVISSPSIKIYSGITTIEAGAAPICFNGETYTENKAEFSENVSVYGGLYANKIYFTDSKDNSKLAITTFDGDVNGQGIRIGAGGATVIGGGESASSFVSDSISAGTLSGATEQMYITSDAHIYFLTNCNTIANRKRVCLSSNGLFYPLTTKEFSVGSSSYRWNNGYFANVYNTSGIITSSDRRIKKDFENIPNALDFIMSLKPYQYKYIDGNSGRSHWGFVAQDVKESLDNICEVDCGVYIEDVKNNNPDEENKSLSECTYDEKELALRYEEFIAPIVATLQSQQNEINNLRNEINNLK